MTPNEADELANQIAATWHGGPRANIWREELLELHGRQAHAAYLMLRREEDKAPSIAHFRQKYQSLTFPHDKNIPDPCPLCDDSGWLPLPDNHHMRHGPLCPGEGCACHAVVPCGGCRTGRDRQKTFDRIHSLYEKPRHLRVRSGSDEPATLSAVIQQEVQF